MLAVLAVFYNRAKTQVLI